MLASFLLFLTMSKPLRANADEILALTLNKSFVFQGGLCMLMFWILPNHP